ncbi:MAG: zinc ribbon domain-containing protein [Gemmatimonadaceae bacterium]|jgi:hypothetical protein|nr:zinc ribbon domain-containing protein [Gemmatimonadaceae bacterium]
MFKALRVPEKLFSIVMWIVSLLFASFLIGLGGQIVGDLPGVDRGVRVETFIDARADSILDTSIRALRERTDSLERMREVVQQSADTARRAQAAEREAFDAWIATRTATTDPQQDPEVLARTRRLDSLVARSRDAARAVERVDGELLVARQQREAFEAERARAREAAMPEYQAATFEEELKVFGIRLLLTLPLLVLAGWAIARKRQSDYWPLWRGFVLFAAFAFFVELVPYLPSYGGYVRSVVGIVASLIAGHYTIRWMRAYVARRAQEAQRDAVERKRSLGWEEALRRVQANICPGCERAVVASPGNTVNYCVHCGLQLYDDCGSCAVRKNAFYAYCPTCGSGTSATGAPTPAASGTD